MNIAKICVERPVLAVMINLVFIFLGLISFGNLGMDLFPTVDIPIVTVRTIWVGADPTEIESQITERVEDAVSTISGVKEVTSYSLDSVSIVSVEFEFGEDIDVAQIDVKDKVDAILSEIPSGAERPIITKVDLGASPILELMATGDKSMRELYDLVDGTIKDELSRVTGVASVDILGGEKREIQINLSKEKLKGYGLAITDVAQVVNAGNVSMPGGRITQTEQAFAIRFEGEVTSLDELRDFDVFLQTGGSVKIHELGSIDDTFEEKRVAARYGGK